MTTSGTGRAGRGRGVERTVEVASLVTADAAAVWARVVTPEGVDHELRPWLSMRMPRGTEGLTVDTVPLERPLGPAVLRLLGVVPCEADWMTIAGVEPGRRFLEESQMVALRRWRHERTVDPAGPGTARVVDRLTLEPRWPLRPAAPLVARLVRALFEHRHRRLAGHFAPARHG